MIMGFIGSILSGSKIQSAVVGGLVAPLTIILPRFIGIEGVFISEAISNFIGGGACYMTMWFTIEKNLKKEIF